MWRLDRFVHQAPLGACRILQRIPIEVIENPLSDGQHQNLVDIRCFDATLSPLRKIDWVVYAKRPFAGPQAVLAYLSRYTHRVAIANSRLISHDERGVTSSGKAIDVRAARDTSP